MEDIQPVIARREVTTRILQAFHLKADKNLGQNFLVEESVVNRIAKAAELAPEDTRSWLRRIRCWKSVPVSAP